MSLDRNHSAADLVTSFVASLIVAVNPVQEAGGQGSPRTKAQGGVRAGREDDQLFARWKKEAAEYQIVLGTSPETPAALRLEPVLSWTNPVRGTYDGLVFVWVSDGRPAAAACFYRVLRERRYFEAHEFHSLAPVPLIGTIGDRRFWSPPAPGVTAKPVPGAPRPASSPSERLRQMRALAREFRASVDVEEGGKELRLLPQPVFRYESEPDGALFAFVQATDPEALMTIDVRPAEGGPAWHYAFGRMSNHSLVAKHRDRVVWEMGFDPDDHNPAKPYCVRWDVGPRDAPGP
jgi:hypothetical protein